MTKITTAWGTAKLLEEVTLPQRAGQKRFASVVQLLEDDKGDWLVRFAYTTDGTARRGPVTLRSADLKRLRDRLDDHPSLAAALGFVGEVSSPRRVLRPQCDLARPRASR
jgi:hypothetical protein